LVPLVGTNIGAGQPERALRIALIGGALTFLATEAIGLGAAVWPRAWLGLFGDDPLMLATGTAYLRSVGPAYGFFGLGLSLYLASQGAGRLLWPLLAGLCRMVIAIGGGGLALHLTGSLQWLFGCLSLALVVYGTTLAQAVKAGVWFRRRGAAGEAAGQASAGGCVRLRTADEARAGGLELAVGGSGAPAARAAHVEVIASAVR
jgi:Na+-driven multidrug efflux pump